MGIENVDEIKPDPAEIYPHFPNVRCTMCGTVYQVDVETTRDVTQIKGYCPKCHNTRFITQLNGSNEEQTKPT